MTSTSLPLRLLTALTLFCLSLAAHAQQWYHVELVVFERLAGANAENWPPMTDIRSGSLTPDMRSTQIQPAPVDSLAGVAQRLRNAAGYRVHYHKAWQQPVLSRASAKSVHVKSDNDLVEGALRLYRVSYLHADIDLWFKENGGLIRSWSDQPESDAMPRGPANPNLKEVRRVRSGDLIYFDHPRIAAILQLRPVATPGAAVPQTPESYSLPADAELSASE